MFSNPGALAPGTVITVKNADGVDHTVTADHAGGFAVTVPAHGTATFHAPDRAGSYAYHCDFHSSMHATLTVR
jgi:plastocyanin